MLKKLTSMLLTGEKLGLHQVFFKKKYLFKCIYQNNHAKVTAIGVFKSVVSALVETYINEYYVLRYISH